MLDGVPVATRNGCRTEAFPHESLRRCVQQVAPLPLLGVGVSQLVPEFRFALRRLAALAELSEQREGLLGR